MLTVYPTGGVMHEVLLDRICPFHARLDASLRFSRLGPGLAALLDPDAAGRSFDDVFELLDPGPGDRPGIAGLTGRRLLLEVRGHGGRLCAQLIDDDGGFVLAATPLLGIPGEDPGVPIPPSLAAAHEQWADAFVGFQRVSQQKSVLEQTVANLTERNAELVALLAVHDDVLENSTDLVQSIGPEGRILYANRAWRETLGFSPDEIPTLNLFDLIAPDRREHCHAIFGRLRAGEPVGLVELALVASDGRRVDLEGSLSVLIEDGVMVGTRGIFRDIGRRSLLQLSEFRDAVLESSWLPIVACDPGGTIVLMNGAAERLTGYTSAEVVGQRTPELWHLPDELAARAGTLTQELGAPLGPGLGVLFAKARQESGEMLAWTLVRGDGSTVPVLVTVTPLRNRMGTLVGFLYVGREAGEQRRGEAQPAESEMRLQQLLEAVPKLGFFVTDPDRSRWFYLSPSLRARLGLGDLAYDDAAVTRIYNAAQHPDDFHPQLRERELHGEQTDFVYRITYPGAQQTWERERTTPVRQPDGSILVYGVIEDVTQERQAEATLRESEQKFRDLWESNRDAQVLCFPPEWRLAGGNAAAVALYGARDAEHLASVKPAIDILSPERQPDGELSSTEMERFFRKALREGSHFFEWTIRRMDGTDVPCEVALTRVMLDGVTGLQATMRDIIERKTAEAALAEERAQLKAANVELTLSNRELEAFAYVASHDLQEPLRAVSGCVGLLAERNQSVLDAESKVFARHAVEGTARMKALIDDLLAYSRVGRSGQSRGPASCERAFARALDNLAKAIEEAGAEITHDPLPTVVGDKLELQTLFQNLLSNAIKFRSDRPLRIHVGVRPAKESGRCEIRISDNGIGIAPKYRDRVMGMFQRLHTRDEYPGTGMGLAICRKIVVQNGGNLWIEDAESGEGTTVAFTLESRGETS